MALELVKLDDQTLPAIANAIRAKTGDTALLLPSQMAAAIESIPSGGEMPELTTPAEVGHVLAGKEYIDGNGTKKTGTMVVCDSIVEAETSGIAGTGVSLELESTADGSTKTMTLRVETGTITPAEDSASLALPCTASPKMFVVLATDATMDSITADNVAAMVSAAGYGKTFPTGTDGSHKDSIIAAVTLHLASGKIGVSGVTCAVSPSVTVGVYSSYRWKAGLEYQWTAYYWED